MKSIATRLTKFLGTDTVVRIDRKPIDEFHLDGFVIAVSKTLVLIHQVDGCTLILNGYAVVRLQDIRSAKAHPGFIPRALRLLNRTPVMSEVDISDWGSTLDSAQQRYPLITIEVETKWPGCSFIGRVEHRTSKFVDLKEIDPKAVWKRTSKFKFKDITKITVDDGYAKALADLDAHEQDVSAADPITARAK